MVRVLIVEGNTPELCAQRSERSLPWAAESFGEALARFAPELEVSVTRPMFSDYAPAEIPVADVDGVVFTGSGVAWAADDTRARPYWELFERAVAAERPVLGCCWGLQVGAVVLGGRVGAGPNGIETAVARGLTLTEAGRAHPMHDGRSAAFDALCMHRDDVLVPPPGAVVTARNDHTEVQGMVHEAAKFWGLQYHPEISVADVANFLSRVSGAFEASYPAHAAEATDYARIAADPEGTADLQARLDLHEGLTDPWRHGVELANWLQTALGTRVHRAAPDRICHDRPLSRGAPPPAPS